MKQRVLKFRNWGVSLLLFIALIMTLSACSTKEVVISNFAADEVYFISGEDTSVTFSAEITGKAEPVYLYSAESGKIGVMTDDGQNGDKVADDNIYSCTVDVKNEDAVELLYYAQASKARSNTVTLHFFLKPTEDSKESVIDFQEEANEIEAEFADEDGYVEYNEIPEIIGLVGKYAEELYKAGELISYEVTESSIVLKWKSGLTSVYSPDVKGTYGIKNENEIVISAYQPYYEWVSTLTGRYIALPSGAENEAVLLEMAANDISALMEKSVVEIYKDSEVSLASIQTFRENQIILWQGHGVYGGSELHSLIDTGASFDWVEWLKFGDYYRDCCQGRIVEYDGSETFSYKYVEEYCPEINNSVVYLGPCQSGYDSVLADSFLSKGATAVIANTETILCLYGDMVQYTTMHLLTQINPDTDDYYTLAEALAEAKIRYGTSDAAYGGYGAEPTIFGGENASNYRLGHYEKITASDFTMPTDLVVTLGELSVIEPEITPADATDYSIKWSSSDTSVATVSPNGEAGIITGLAKGTATITAELTSGSKTITKTTNLRVASKGRDTVLVLDISGSMYGEPLEEMKKSAVQFCNDLLKDEYNNRVGIVFYDDEVKTIDLTNDLDMLTSRINSVSDGGTTNMEAGLAAADKMLKNSGKADAIKNVVIMADGIPNEGNVSYSNSMPNGGYGYYYSALYANAVIDTAKSMMNSYNLYSLGFFHSLYDDERDFAMTLMKELTNKEDGYHQVDKAEDLQFAFGDISEDINVGSKIVINIACPVDVRVTYGGEMLSSAKDAFCDATSFGTLQLLGKDKDIKVVSLDSDKEYEIELIGTGVGKMDYSVSYFDEKEQLFDYRSFEAIPITVTTVIKSTTDNVAENITLNIDDDGDGIVDVIWTALEKSKGQITFEKDPPELELPEVELPQVEVNVDNQVVEIFIICALAFVLVFGGLVAVVLITKSKHTDDDGEGSAEKEIISDDVIAYRYQCPRCGAEVEGGNEWSCWNCGYRSTDDVKNEEQIITEDTERNVGFVRVMSGSMNGFTVPVKDGETLYLGKDSRYVNIVFTGDYSKVSRVHCSVTFDAKANRYFVTDSSTNGTYLANKTRLTKGKRTAVSVNTILLLANSGCTVLLG